MSSSFELLRVCMFQLTWSKCSNEVNETASATPPSSPPHTHSHTHSDTPLFPGPTGHISVMAPYRSWGLLVHTQCPSIGTLLRVSEGCFTSCGWRRVCARVSSFCACVRKTAPVYILRKETCCCALIKPQMRSKTSQHKDINSRHKKTLWATLQCPSRETSQKKKKTPSPRLSGKKSLINQSNHMKTLLVIVAAWFIEGLDLGQALPPPFSLLPSFIPPLSCLFFPSLPSLPK